MEPKKAHKPWSWKEWEAYHRRASLPNWHASGVGFTVCVWLSSWDMSQTYQCVLWRYQISSVKSHEIRAIDPLCQQSCSSCCRSQSFLEATQLERSMVAKSTKSDRIWQIFTSPWEAAGIQGRCSCGASLRVGTCWSIDPHRPRAETLETGCPPRWNCSSFIGLNSEKTESNTESNTGSYWVNTILKKEWYIVIFSYIFHWLTGSNFIQFHIENHQVGSSTVPGHRLASWGR